MRKNTLRWRPELEKFFVRNIRIHDEYLAGSETLKQVGKRYGITATRIREIVIKVARQRRIGITTPEQYKTTFFGEYGE